MFAALSACGYAVDVSTQAITDALSLDVRPRFETRAAVAAVASAAFPAQRLARARRIDAARRRASSRHPLSTRLLAGVRGET